MLEGLKSAFSSFADAAGEKKPEVLLGLTGLGIIATIVVTAIEVPKIKEAVDEMVQDLRDTAPEDKEVKKEVVVTGAKKIVPRALAIVTVAAMTFGSAVGMHNELSDRLASMTTLYIMADKSLSEWKDASKEVLDKKDYEKVEEQVRDNQFKAAVTEQGLRKDILPGQHVFIDKATNQIFYDDLNRIIRIVEHLNNDFDTGREEFKTWNELLRELGEKELDSYNGTCLGFNSRSGGIKLDYGSYVDDDTKIVYGYIDYPVEARYRYG